MTQLMIEEDDLRTRGMGALGASQHIETLRSRDLTPVEEATNGAALKVMSDIEVPGFYDKLDPEVITNVPSVADDVGQAVGRVRVKEANPAFEALAAGLKFEQHAIGKLAGIEADTKKSLGTIDQLLNLSSLFSGLPDKDKHEISADMRSILNDLKANKGIDLLKGDSNTVTKEQLIELKSAIGSHIDRKRTETQQFFMHMQTWIQHMTSVNDSSKRGITEFVNFLRTVVRNQRPG